MKRTAFGILAEGPDTAALRTDTADASSLLLTISTLERKLNLDGCLGVELREVTTEPADER
jgi:hypothetical protein